MSLAVRILLVLVALDSLLTGLWAAARPAELFGALGLVPRSDAWAWQLFADLDTVPRDAGLWQLTGMLLVAQAILLGLAAWWPDRLGGLVAVPLVGRAVLTGVWLWAWGAAMTFPPRRQPFATPDPLPWLAAHDGLVALVLLALLTLLTVRRSRS